MPDPTPTPVPVKKPDPEPKPSKRQQLVDKVVKELRDGFADVPVVEQEQILKDIMERAKVITVAAGAVHGPQSPAQQMPPPEPTKSTKK